MEDELLRGLGRRQRELASADDNENMPAPEAQDPQRPLDEGERNALLDAVFERVDAETPVAATQTAGDETPVVNLAQRRASRRNTAIIGVIVAAAAAALLWWAMTLPSRPDPERIAALPAYTITRLDAGVATQRSQTDAVPDRIELNASGELDMVMTPAKQVGHDVTVAILAESSTGETRFATLGETAKVSPAGAVRLQGPLDRFIGLEPGRWTLRVLIGPPDRLPRDADEAKAVGEPTPWQTVTVQATIVTHP